MAKNVTQGEARFALGVSPKSTKRLLRAGRLSDREFDVLFWAAQGKTKSETAEILHLSEYTVHSYVRQVLKKLDAVNLPHAVYLALRNGAVF